MLLGSISQKDAAETNFRSRGYTMTDINKVQIGGSHYKTKEGHPEVWDCIMDWGLGYLDGNVVKYLARWKRKGTPLQDLLKAQHYLTKLIDRESRCLEQAEHDEAQQDIMDLERIATKFSSPGGKAGKLLGSTSLTPPLPATPSTK